MFEKRGTILSAFKYCYWMQFYIYFIHGSNILDFEEWLQKIQKVVN